MSEKENLVLSEKAIKPNDDIVFGIIGDKKSLWESIMSYAKNNYEDVAGDWNYYNDGKQWLFKLTRKKKTIFWIGVLSYSFRVTFWFPDRAETIIDGSDLPQTLKDGFKSAKKYGSTRAVSIIIINKSDAENVLKLIDIKAGLK